MDTNLGFLKIIQEIESELAPKYIPGAIRFIDETYDGAWSKAIDRFEHSLLSGNFEAMKFEGDLYRKTIIYFIEKYKRHNRGNDINHFLNTVYDKP